jgi:hypothetical protein
LEFGAFLGAVLLLVPAGAVVVLSSFGLGDGVGVVGTSAALPGE